MTSPNGTHNAEAAARTSATPADMDLMDLREERDQLRFAREDNGRLSPEQEQRLADLTRENDARQAQIRAEKVRADHARKDREHDAWLAERGAYTDDQTRLRQAVTGLMRDESDLVDLDKVRAALPGMSPAAFTAAVVDLCDDPDVFLVPHTDQSQVTESRAAASVRVGGKDKHLIRFRNH